MSALCSQAARRYAGAFLDLAHDWKLIARARANLDAVGRWMADCPELARFCRDYALSMAARRRVLDRIFDGRVHARTWQLLLFLEKRRRLGLLADLCRAFGELHDQRRGVLKGTLASAFTLSETETRAITERACSLTRQTVSLTVGVAPALLGGFRLQVRDTVYDLSLAGALADFRRRAGGAGD